MSRREKWFLLISGIIVGFGAIFYLWNIDVYRCVGNYSPVYGYADFVNRLSDLDFVLANVESWATSSSWVLQSLYAYLTVEGAEFGSFDILYTQMVITLTFYYLWVALLAIIIRCTRWWNENQNEGGYLWCENYGLYCYVPV